MKDAFIKNCESSGVEIVYTGECMTTDTDYFSQATQAVANRAELLYYPCFQDTVPLLVGAARNAGFTGAIMGCDGRDGSDTTGLAAQFEDCYLCGFRLLYGHWRRRLRPLYLRGSGHGAAAAPEHGCGSLYQG